MQLRIRSRGLEITRETRHAAERRLRVVLGRHAARVAEVRVSLSHEAGRMQPEAFGCEVRVALEDGGHLALEGRAGGAEEAVAHVAWRLGRRLERERMLRGTRGGGSSLASPA